MKTRPVYVMGVSMSNHDRSACLIRDGEVVGAIAEERLDRRKRSEAFYGHAPRDVVIPPLAAITRLIRDERIRLDDVDLIVCGRSRRSARDTLLTYLPLSEDRVVEPASPGHHLAHAYSAYAAAPFSASAVLVIDEQGHTTEDGYEAASWFEGDGHGLRVLKRFLATEEELSLGMIYNVFAAMVGLSEAGRPAAGKLMALAARGRSRLDWPRLIRNDGDRTSATALLSDVDAFLVSAGVPIASGMETLRVLAIDDLLVKYEPIAWASPLAADLARKAQDELETGVLHLARGLFDTSTHRYLSYAGGVALNCSANARLREAGWSDVFVQPAATDDGAALGLALYGHIEHLNKPRPDVRRFRPYLGPLHSPGEIGRALSRYGLSDHALRPAKLTREVAELLEEGQVVCWFEGRSEWGPRALGARSLIASPRIEGIRDRINAEMKFREPFRPLAIAVTERAAETLGSLSEVAPGLRAYMLGVLPLADQRFPEIAHEDGTVRIQVIEPDLAPSRFIELLEVMEALTGLAAVINTSFNSLGEPLVESPEDAVRQFLLMGADALVLEDRLIAVADLPPAVHTAALRAAWSRTPIDPIDAAIGVTRAGHRASAARILIEAEVDESQARLRGPGTHELVQLLLSTIVQGDETS